MGKDLSLVIVHNPFKRTDRDIKTVPYNGEPLSEIVKRNLPQDVDVVVSINGKPIPKEIWDKTYLKAGDQVLIVPKIHGGGDDDDKGEGILGAIASIAIAVVSVAVGGAVLGAIGGWAGRILGAIAATATYAVGGMIVNTILPPPQPKLPNTEALRGFDTSPTYSWNPQTTQSQGVVIPRIYGECKVYGNVISTYIENQGDDQYLNVLIALGQGPIKEIKDIKINDQPYTDYKGVTIETRPGAIDQPIIPNFNNTKVEYIKNTLVSYGSPVTITTENDDFDALEVDITFPQGLWYANDQGGLSRYSVNVAVKYRKKGETTWHYATEHIWKEKVGKWVQGRWSFGRWIGVKEQNVENLVWIRPRWLEIKEGPSNKWDLPWTEQEETVNDWIKTTYFFWGLPFNKYAPPESSPWLTIDGERGFWRWIDKEYVYSYESVVHPYITISGAKTKPIRRTFHIPQLERGTYEIQVEKLTPDKNSSRYGDELYVTAVREIYYDDFEYPRLALVGVRALASNQLSGSFKFSCVVKGQLVRIWDGSSWKVDWTDNPAWICYDLLTQPVFDNDLNVVAYEGIDPSRIDLEKFKEWADFCDELVPDGKGGYEKRCTFNGIFDTEMSLWEAALKVCEVGRASLVWNGSKLTVAIDKPSPPVQLFSVGNIIEDTFREIFLPQEERVGEIEINYLDKDKDYERTILTIFDGDLKASTNKLSLNVFGITKQSEAYRYGLYRLYLNKYLRRMVEFEADIDAIACTVGDVILVQHDVPQWGYGGRLQSATSNTVTLDREVYIDTSKQYRIMIRLSDDTIVERDIVNPASSGNYQTLTVSTPFDTTPQAYDVYAIGEVELETKPFRVLALSKTQDQRVKITAIEYNESVYNADYGLPATPTAQYSALETVPSVRNLKVNEVVLKGSGNTIYSVLDVYFDPPTDQSLYDHAEIYLDGGNGPVYVGSTKGDYFRITGVEEGNTYSVIVRAVNVFGKKEPLDKAPSVEITTLGKLAPPSDVTNFKAKQSGLGILLTWDHIPDVDRAGYEIRMGPSWAAGQVIATNVADNFYEISKVVDGTYTFWIKAIDTGGRYSINASRASITVSGVSERLNVVLEQDELTKASPADGLKTNLVFISPSTSGASITALTWLHMLTDLDCPNWNDATPEITNYDGSINTTGSYESNPIDLGKIVTANLKLFVEVDGSDPKVTDQSYPDRTDLTYPNDTDQHVTIPVDLKVYYSLSNDGVTWSAWEEYRKPIDETFRYLKVRCDLSFDSRTAIVRLLRLYYVLDVPDKYLKIENFSVPATGVDIAFADYGVSFIKAPLVGVTVLNATGSLTPVVSNKTNAGFRLELYDTSNTKVSGTVDIEVKGY